MPLVLPDLVIPNAAYLAQNTAIFPGLIACRDEGRAGSAQAL